MPVDLYFPVPLVIQDVNTALRDTIRANVSAYFESEKARQDIAPAPEESVATSYYRPEASIVEDANLAGLEAFVIETGKAYLERTLKLPPRRLEIERAWINVFEPGAQEAQHTHDGSLLSCSYYVEAPEGCGCIVFPDPITARRSYREFTKTTGDELLTRADIAVAPAPGRLVMFESWVPHYVQCNKTDKPRISIAFNLRQASVPTPAAAAPRESTGAADPGRRNPAPAVAAPETASAGAKPFLFNDLFAVNESLNLTLEPIRDAIPAAIIDDFLKHPEQVRDLIGRTPAANWKNDPGGRNFVDYYDCRLRFPIRSPNSMVTAARQAILKVWGVDTRPADASVDVNWFMQIHEKRGDFAVPHNDLTENVRRSFTCIVYLNRSDECSGGTAFFRLRKSGSLVLDQAYIQAAKQDPGITETGLDYWPDRADELWERIGTVEMAPGRLLIFPSEYFHAAWHPQNSFYDFPRLTLAYWMVC